MGEAQDVERQAEPILAVLLTEAEFQLTMQLLQASQVPFGTPCRLATAVEGKFRNAMPVNRRPAEAPPEEEPSEQPEEQVEE